MRTAKRGGPRAGYSDRADAVEVLALRAKTSKIVDDDDGAGGGDGERIGTSSTEGVGEGRGEVPKNSSN